MGRAEAAAVIQKAEGADDVGDFVVHLAIHRGPNPSQCGQMDDGIEATVWQYSLADVAGDSLAASKTA